jgi:hypothetical protein
MLAHFCKLCQFKAVTISGQAKPGRLLRAAPQVNPRQAKILTLSRQLAEHAEAQGLHSLFACLRTIHPAVVFFCHTFCNQPYIHSVVFFKPLFQSTHKSKKTLCIPTAATMHA